MHYSINPYQKIKYRFVAGDPGNDTFTYTIDFGDGSSEVTKTSFSHHITISHEYNSKGSYTIHLTVVDDDGGIGTVSKTVQVVLADPATETARRITRLLGGGKADIGLIIFGTIIAVPTLLGVGFWLKIPKWWRGCPMSARLIISLIPIAIVIGLLILNGVLPLVEYLFT